MATKAYNLTIRNLPIGITPIPATAVSGATVLFAQIARCTAAAPTIWPDAAVSLTFDMQVSYDNQVTWSTLGSFSDTGGLRTTRHGEVAFSFISCSFVQQATHVKGTLTVAGGVCRTSGAIWRE